LIHMMSNVNLRGVLMTKRTMYVLLATAVLVLGLVSLAYADAVSSYAPWTSIGFNAGSLSTPHKDYRVSTVKCSVCHAVHKAPATTGAELLLRSSVAGSCAYCHVANNYSLSLLYGGVEANYNGPDQATAHGAALPGATVGSRCVDCHSVHGASTMTTPTAVSNKILRTQAGYTGNHTDFQADATAALGTVATRDAQITVFCTLCHPYFQEKHNGTINLAYPYTGVPTQSVTAYQSHIMTAASASFNAPGATQNLGRVAWADSSYCRSCHDAGKLDMVAVAGINTDSFPHYTEKFTRFMISQVSTSSPDATTTYTQATGPTDGVCLKCHVGTSGTSPGGVGVTY
jgi:nitrate/TMAO reductase-like tetraheme cytochrome c subunit